MIVAFFDRRGELERRLPALAGALDPAGGLWIAWPKRASGVQTDVTENVVRDLGLAAGLVDNKVCAIDQVWSGLRLVYRLRDRPRLALADRLGRGLPGVSGSRFRRTEPLRSVVPAEVYDHCGAGG